MELKKMKNLFKLNSKTRYAGMAALANITVLIILVVGNLIIQKIPADWDLTRRKIFSLTEQSRSFLETLENETVIYLLSKPGREAKEVLQVLKEYEKGSKYIQLEVVDPDRNPTLVKSFAQEGQVIPGGSVIVSSGKYSRVIENMDLYNVSYNQQGTPEIMGVNVEQRVTSALAYVTTGREPVIYELEGHDEFTLSDLNLTEQIEKANYKAKTLNLLREGKVPEDADVLVILSPTRDLAEVEAQALAAYLENKGALFLAVDLAKEDFPVLNDLLKSYNMSIVKGVVMETDTSRLLPGFGNNPLFFSPRLKKENPITTPLLENNLDMFVFTALGLTETEIKKRNVEVETLLLSSNASWLRTDMTNSSESRSGNDIPGPIPVAMSAAVQNRDTGEEDGARLVVLTSGKSFSSLTGIGQIKANIEFFMNSLSWLSNQNDTISISSKTLYRMPLRLNALQAWIYAGIAILLLPLIVILTGTIIHLRRKNL